MKRVLNVTAMAEVVALIWLALGTAQARAEDTKSMPMNMPMDHSHHHHMMMPAGDDQRSVQQYKVPSAALIRQDGSQVDFSKELEDGRPVMLNFMYTSCTAICPVTTQVFSQVQDKLGADAAKVHMISVSIDPEFDTPKRLDAYAKKYKAGAQWQFYTGSREASLVVQKAFDAYRGDKMNHAPVTYMRAAPGKPWIRLDGLRSPDDLVKEMRGLMANS